jgi:hypothetical protein
MICVARLHERYMRVWHRISALPCLQPCMRDEQGDKKDLNVTLYER